MYDFLSKYPNGLTSDQIIKHFQVDIDQEMKKSNSKQALYNFRRTLRTLATLKKRNQINVWILRHE